MMRFRNPNPGDAPRCHAIETSAYEGEEAASLDRIALRIANYPQGFLLLEVDGLIAGFVNSGCANEVHMADDAFKELVGHDPDAPNAVILSVAVAPDFQGQGLARVLMEEFIDRMRAMKKVTIHLMCRDHHVALYEKFGFDYLGPSSSGHGGRAWHDMVRPL